MSEAFHTLGLTKELLVFVGPGGVGKTSLAAAVALQAAVAGRNVILLTIDPAKRLAGALGLSHLSDELRTVPLPAASLSQPEHAAEAASGSLRAAMLDTQASYDSLVRRIAPTEEQANAIFENPMYRAFSRTLARSHAYVAMERLHSVLDDESVDLVVLDTPPTRSALDILDAPGRLLRFLDADVVKAFLPAENSRWSFRGAGNLAQRGLSLLAGKGLGQEMAEFFGLFVRMREGFVARTARVNEQLRAAGTAFVLVVSPERNHLHDARALHSGLRGRDVPLSALIVNRAFRLAPGAVDSSAPEPIWYDREPPEPLPSAEELPLVEEASVPLADALAVLYRQVASENRRKQRALADFQKQIGSEGLTLLLPQLPALNGDQDLLRLLSLGRTPPAGIRAKRLGFLDCNCNCNVG